MERIKSYFGERTAMRISLTLCLIALALIVAVRLFGTKNPYSAARMQENVTLVCRETGEEFVMPRGRMEVQLYERPGPLDPNVGLINPKTGRPTLFPKSAWEATIERINSDREAVRANSRHGQRHSNEE